MLKLMRYKLASLAWRFHFYRLGCAIRGRHMSREQAGRCLVCATPMPDTRPAVVKRRERYVIENAWERRQRILKENARIRQDSLVNGL